MDARVTTLAAMLDGDDEYVIPQFQRPYAWKRDEQWSPLWNDIVNKANAIAAVADAESVPPHFMGPLVIQERNPSDDGRPPGYIVVDGQQRMTTMLVLLKAVGDAAAELGMPEQAELFHSRIWNDLAYGAKAPKVRHSNDRDRAALLEVLMGFADTDAYSSIADCYAFFNDAAADYMRAQENRAERCQNLLLTLDAKMQTAVLLLDPEEQPNIVFETLNARAEPLKQSELVKNTVMYEGGVVEDADRAAQLWSKDFEDDYWRRESDGSSKLDFFLSDWLTARLEKRVTPNRVSPEFLAYLQKAKSVTPRLQYVTDRLNLAARIYREVEAGEFTASLPSSQRLLDMRIPTVLPVILWLWDRDSQVEPRERQSALRIVESYIIRRILAGLNVSATLMNTMIDLLAHLRAATENGQSHSNAVRNMLTGGISDNARWPRDREIYDKISQTAHGMNVTRRDVVLTALENRLRRERGKSPLDFKAQSALLMPSSDAGLMHYRPPGRLTETRKRRLDERIGMLGNLTLTKKRMTQKEQDLPWLDKLLVLQNHKEIELTRLLLDENGGEWTEKAIEDRSNLLAELAIRTWPRPTD